MSAPAALLERHPLLRRLSGQAVWRLLEEGGAPEQRITAFLDRFEQAKAAVLDILRRAADPAERAARPWVLLRLAPGAAACDRCRNLHHVLAPATHPDLPRLLPPFGLGCGLRAGLAGAAELAALDPAPAPLAESLAPEHALLCGEWIFTHPWES